MHTFICICIYAYIYIYVCIYNMCYLFSFYVLLPLICLVYAVVDVIIIAMIISNNNNNNNLLHNIYSFLFNPPRFRFTASLIVHLFTIRIKRYISSLTCLINYLSICSPFSFLVTTAQRSLNKLTRSLGGSIIIIFFNNY